MNKTLVALVIELVLAGFAQAQECDPAPAGLAGWWPGEMNANDAVNLNQGSPVGGLSFTAGKVAQGFSFNGSDAAVHIPASATLDVGASSGFTLEAWVAPRDAVQPRPLLQWNTLLMPNFGVSLWLSVPAANGGSGPGCLLMDVADSRARHHVVCSAPGSILAGEWQHIAATYNRADGTATLYLNGAVLLQTNLGTVAPFTAQDLWLGCENDLVLGDLFYSIGNGRAWYAGLLDEISIYSRPLTPAEIASVFNAGGAGKCPIAPSAAIVQPAGQTVAEGEAAIFTALASGSPPLRFQWRCDGADLLGATDLSLVLTNVQATNAGRYSVQVANAIGAVVSSNVPLSVLSSYAPTWSTTTAPTNNWTAVASSADGERLVASAYDGFIYTSSDGGATWVSNSVPRLTWYSVASSADGERLYATAITLSGMAPGGIYASTNAGTTWRLLNSGAWNSVVCSANGTRSFAVGVYGSWGNIFSSADSGFTWTQSSPSAAWTGLRCSADGTRLVACDELYHKIYTCSDPGKTWTLTAAPTTNWWNDIACSADGVRLAAAAYYQGPIFVSTNSGQSWAPTGAPLQNWRAISCSADGTKLVAGVYGGYLYVSPNGGASWTVTRAPSANWSSVASSVDGTRLVAAMWPGGIYTWQPTKLNIVLSGSNLVINWPTNVPGFVLQQKAVSDSALWMNVTNVPAVNGSWYQVVLPGLEGSEMFRLMYP